MSSAITSSQLRNREAPHGNVLCHQKSVERAYGLHCLRVSHCRSDMKLLTEQPDRRFAFLEKRISKTFQLAARSRQIVKENAQLLAKLRSIQDNNANKTKPYRRTEHWQNALKAQARRRAKHRIESENASMERRLKSLKSHYSVLDMAKARRKERKIMRLRHTDYTAGHLHKIAMPRSRRHTLSSVTSFPTTHASTTFRPLTPQNPSSVDTPKRQSAVPPVVSTQNRRRMLSTAKRDEDEHIVVQAQKAAHRSAEEDVTLEDVAPPGRRLSTNSERVVYETRREYDQVGECVVRVAASEPFTILTELRVAAYQRTRTAIAEYVLTVNEAAMQHGLSDYVSKSDWDDAYDLQELLMNMFKEADINGNGALSVDEFRVLMEDADLGLSSSECHLLMVEADENDDREINYEEFMPIAIDLIQSFKARRYAKKTIEKDQEKISEATLHKLHGPDIEAAATEAERLFKEADAKVVTGSLSRPEFRKCLKHPTLNLSKTEQKMIMDAMPVNAFGKLVYSKFVDKLYQVKYTTIRQNIVESQASDIGKLLLNLCREQERLILPNDTSHGDEEDAADVPYTGLVTVNQMQAALTHPKVGLNRLQVTSVMSDAPIMYSMVDYWTFVPIAAKAIEKLHDPSVIEAKVALLSSKGLTTEQGAGFNEKSEAQAAKELTELFDIYDADGSGLDAGEFAVVLESLDLGLTKGNIDTLMTSADENEDHVINRDEFMRFAMRHLLRLIKRRRMAMLQKDLSAVALGERIDSSAFDISDDALRELANQSWDADTIKTISGLIAIFRTADVTREGCLSASEFHRVLDAMELGLTQYQKARLMAEADENADGYISYLEFVPVTLRLLQTFRAKKVALQSWQDRQAKVEEEAAAKASEATAELGTAIHIVEHAFREAAKLERGDDQNHPKLSRQNFLRCLEVPHAGLSYDLIQSVAERIKPNDGGLTPTAKFKAELYQAHMDLVRREVFRAHEPESTLESHIKELLQHQAESEHSSSSCNTSLSSTEIHQALFQAKHLRLSRQQLMSIMSLCDECLITNHDEETDDKKLVDTNKFAACAAFVIADLFDITKIEQRTHIAKCVRSQSSNLLRGDRRPELLALLRDQFAKREATTNGARRSLSVNEFCAVLQSITPLDLTRTELTTVCGNAPFADSGEVLWESFLAECGDVFNTLAGERQLRSMGHLAAAAASTSGGHKGLPSTFSERTYHSANVLERQQVANLCKALVAKSSLERTYDDEVHAFQFAFAGGAVAAPVLPPAPSGPGSQSDTTPETPLTAGEQGARRLAEPNVGPIANAPLGTLVYWVSTPVPVYDATTSMSLGVLACHLGIVKTSDVRVTLTLDAHSTSAASCFEKALRLPALASVDPLASSHFFNKLRTSLSIVRDGSSASFSYTMRLMPPSGGLVDDTQNAGAMAAAAPSFTR